MRALRQTRKGFQGDGQPARGTSPAVGRAIFSTGALQGCRVVAFPCVPTGPQRCGALSTGNHPHRSQQTANTDPHPRKWPLRAFPEGGGPSGVPVESEDTPAPFIPPYVRRTTRRVVTEETIIEEPLPSPAPGASPVEAPGVSPRPAPSLVREAKPAPKPLAPTSLAWERSQAQTAQQYWRAHLGEVPHHLPRHLVQFIREWGLEQLETAFDQVLDASPEGTPRRRYQVLLRLLAQWRKAAGRGEETSSLDGEDD